MSELHSDEYVTQEDLRHYGILRKSGRYPWGSGKDEYQRSLKFAALVEGLKAKGIPEKDMAKAMGLDPKEFTVAMLRDTKSMAKEIRIAEETAQVVGLRYDSKGNAKNSIDAIAERTGIPAPTVRLRLKNAENIKESALRQTANMLKKTVDEHQIVDVGKGVNLHLNISPEKLRAAVGVLRDEGYETHILKTKNVGTNNMTTRVVLVPPGTGWAGANALKSKIHTIGEWTENGGETYFGIHPPLSVSSKRVQVKFAEDGGTAEDGAIYVRRGVKDLDMGKNTYAQVRILVDGTHYIKGVAILKDDLPAGVDLVVNSNKSRSVGKLGALKPITDDADNPFGAVINRQIFETDSKTGQQKLKSAINLVNEEGDWDDWRKSLPSQMLSKQPHSFIKTQLDATRKQTREKLDEINAITNPIVRKKALEDFADKTDADAVDLRAAAMPGQRTQLIVPVPKLNKHEIYAPNFETGDRVALIRYPHGGRFEIPEVTVNNNNRTAKKLLGNAKDAIGIHPSVAARLSGADFDGDTVVVIPNSSGKIKGINSLGSDAKYYEKELANFEPKIRYGGFVQTGTDKKGNPVGNYKLMRNTGMEMGMITNLITDMSIQGAKPEHIVRAVRHSMVVIDAEKHKLNFKQSEIDNNIAQLRAEYQGGKKTLLSAATAKQRVPERKKRLMRDGGPIDPKTGELIYVETGKTNNKFDKKTSTYLDDVKVPKLENVKSLALTNDAYTLTRDRNDPVERLYADHANEMKSIANKARLQIARTPDPPTNRAAKLVYKEEVDDLTRQLNAAKKQKPLDRRADDIANAAYRAKLKEDPSIRFDLDKKKKVERQVKKAARNRLGLSKPVIDISDSQWDAIQSGAVSPSKLREILGYADSKRVAELSRPRKNAVMTSAVTSRAKAMLRAGATNAEIAAALGISPSTLKDAIKRGDV